MFVFYFLLILYFYLLTVYAVLDNILAIVGLGKLHPFSNIKQKNRDKNLYLPQSIDNREYLYVSRCAKGEKSISLSQSLHTF